MKRIAMRLSFCFCFSFLFVFLFYVIYPKLALAANSMNPVYHFNVNNTDLMKGIHQVIFLKSNIPQNFELKEVNILEKPEGLSVEPYVSGMEGFSSLPLKGFFINPQLPIRFTVQIKASHELPLGNHRVRIGCRFTRSNIYSMNFYTNITMFLHVIRSNIQYEIYERGFSDDLDNINTTGLIAQFDENSYYDENETRITEQVIYEAKKSISAKVKKVGLTADGNTRLMVVATTNSSQDLLFTLKNEKGAAIGFNLETLDRKRERVNFLGDLSLRISPTLVQNTPMALYQGTIVIVAPNEFPPIHRGKDSFEVLMEISQYNEDGEIVLEESTVIQPIIVCEPPVIFLHGFNGNISKFGTESDEESIFSRIHSVSFIPPFSFGYTKYLGPSEVMLPQERSLVDTIRTRLALMNKFGIASTRVDLVGHSMGGMVARQFIQNNEINKKSILAYQKGLVRRLIFPETRKINQRNRLKMPRSCFRQKLYPFC